MIYAYFNDCLPRNLSIQAYANALEQTARGFRHLHANHPQYKNVLGGIITNSEKSMHLLDGNAITLEQCIRKINDKDIRNLLIAWTANYPETSFFQEEVDEEAILNEDYHLNFDDDRQNAINLILAKYNGAFLFSLNLHPILGVNEVSVQGNNNNVLVNNLYGDKKVNTDFIARIIKEAHNRTLDTHLQIESILQNVVKHNAYDSEYSKLSNIEQTAILERWKEASVKKLLNHFMPDDDIIKKTEGPQKQEKRLGPVYELRVRQPRELRIYFQYVEATYYLLDIKDKTHQDIDIKNAFAKARQLRALK
ncbi:MAG: hypothetical protein NC113_03030 [Bacteroides sp.]|nr:hypothetical protein [Bacteroides sp.]MCM1447185.1 hypothetical protein [Bacteroides sp.]MCM1515077.1 hypothetical protein [Paraprevotella sp.]